MASVRALRARTTGFLLAGLLVAFVLAGLVSGFADSDPDGLEKVAQDKGFLQTAQDHALSDSPLADYGVSGIDNERLSVGLAGLIGVTITFVFGLGLFLLVRRARRNAAPAVTDRG